VVTAGAEKPAVTDWAWLRVTVQVGAVPVQAPNQPPKVEPVAGAAIRELLGFLFFIVQILLYTNMPAYHGATLQTLDDQI